MAYDIGPKIGVEGEAEYRNQLKQIVTTQKTLNTEMLATASAFDKGEKSVEAYTAKNEVLEKQIDAQKDKLEILRRAVSDAAEKYGEADERTQKWQQILNRATAELNDMERELRDNKAAVEELDGPLLQIGKDCDATGREYKNFIDRLKDNVSITDIINLAKTAADVIRDVADAVVSLATDAAAFGDDMATLSVQTGVSTETLQEFDYMSGLIDVDLGTITGALSKTTKQMAKGSKAFDTLGVSVRDANGELRDNEDVFFEAIDALGKIENETERDALAMELFGKNAQELNPLIAAGSDRLKELAQEAHDAGYVLSDETISALGAGQDELDRFAKASEAAKNAVGAQLLPSLANLAKGGSSIASAFAVALNETGSVSSALSAGKDMAMQVLQGIIESAPEMAQAAGELLSELAVDIVQMAPQLIELGLVILESFVEGISENTDALIPAVVDAIITITMALINHIPDLIAAAGQLLGALTSGLIQAIPHLVMAIPEIILAILTALGEGFAALVGVGEDMVRGIWEGIKDSIAWVKQKISEWVGEVVGFFKDMLGIASPSKVMADQVGEQMAAGVGEGFTDGLTDVERDMAAAQEDLNRKMAGMAAGLESSVTVNAGAGPIEHRFSGTIRVEGVGSQGEFIASTDILIDQIVDALRREARFA